MLHVLSLDFTDVHIGFCNYYKNMHKSCFPGFSRDLAYLPDSRMASQMSLETPKQGVVMMVMALINKYVLMYIFI